MTIEMTLRSHGVNASGARAIAEAVDDLGELWDTPLEEVREFDGVGAKTLRQLEELYPDTTPLPVSEAVGTSEIRVDDTTIQVDALERPGRIPDTYEHRLIDYATQVLERVPQLSRASDRESHIGHHEEIRRSMTKWARTDDAPDDAHEVVTSMSPDERNFGRITAPSADTPLERFWTRYRKAEIVLSWAEAVFDESALDDVRDGVDAEYRDAVEDAAGERAAQQRGERLLADPPAEINGWEHTSTQGDGFALAYRGWSQGTRHMVTAAYRDADGSLQVDQFAYPAWVAEADGDPREIRENKRLSFDEFETEADAVATLVEKLEAWPGHPNHDADAYPTEVNGWLARYIDEDGLQKLEYVEPLEDESLSIEGGEDEPWWLQYDDPDGRTTDIWEDDTLEGARDVLLDAMSRMMAVEGGGSLARHQEIARNLHRVDDGEPAVDPIHHDDETARDPPTAVAGWQQPPDHHRVKPLAEVVWTDGGVDAGVLRYTDLVAIYREDDGEYRVLREQQAEQTGASSGEPAVLATGRDWNEIVSAAEEWLLDNPAWSDPESRGDTSDDSPSGGRGGTEQAQLF